MTRWNIALAIALFGVTTAHVRAQEVIGPGVRAGVAMPAWAESVEVPAADESGEGARLLLQDVQWRVDDDTATELVHRAFALRTATAVAALSEVQFDIPSRTRLDIHAIRRIRAGVTTSVLVPADVRVIQPEEGLGHGVIDESRRAIVILEDVRVGDVIEYVFSRTEPTQILEGRFSTRALLDIGRASFSRFSAHWPIERSIAFRTHALPASFEVHDAPGQLEIVGHHVERPNVPDDAPHWVDRDAWVELSELRTWDEVVQWALPRFSFEDATLSDVPLATFEALETDEARVVAALRYVQDEVRYLGLEMGESALVPHAPDQVAHRRYGDCKDKALLLVAILAALHVEAHVALVDTERGHVLPEELPSPFAFDHAIVVAHVGDHDVWMDATLTHERGPLSALAPIPFERALVIAPGTHDFTPIPMAPRADADVTVEERYVVRDGSTELEVDSVMRGSDAAMMRGMLEAMGAERMDENLRGFYADAELEPTTLEPPRFDEADDGSLHIHEHYRVAHFWDWHSRNVSAWAGLDVLPTLAPERPPAPVQLRFPRLVVHRVFIDELAGWDITPARETMTTPDFEVARTTTVHGTRLGLETRLRTLRAVVPTDETARYARDHEHALDLLGYEIVRGIDREPEDGRKETLWAFGIMIVLAIVVAIVVFVRARWTERRSRRRQRAWAAKTRANDGETGAAAIEVQSMDDARARGRPPVCCDARVEGGQWTRAQLAGNALFVHAAVCPSCGQTRRTYYRLPS